MTKPATKKPRQLKRQPRKAKPRKMSMLEASLQELTGIKKSNSKRVRDEKPTIFN